MSHTSSVSEVPIKSESALRAAVDELIASGVNCELVPNAVPRMYYADQINRHVKQKQEQDERNGNETQGIQFHDNPEECDYVLRVNDAYYDVGFLRNKDGHLVPFFDDYNYSSHSVPGTQSGKGPIRDFIGANYEGNVEHWSGQRDSSEGLMHSVGQLLQGYSKHAAIEAATAAGYSVMGQEVDDKGQVHLTLEVL